MLGQQGSGGSMLWVEIERGGAPLQALLVRLPTIGQPTDFGADIGILGPAGEVVEQLAKAGQRLLRCLPVGHVLFGVGVAAGQPQGPAKGIPQLRILWLDCDCGGESLDGSFRMTFHQFQATSSFKGGGVVRMATEPAGEFFAGGR